MGVIIGFIIGTAVISVLCNLAIRQFFVATPLAAFLAVILLQVLSYIELGHVDKFVIIAVITSTLIALPAAFLGGLPVLIFRKTYRSSPH